MAADNPEFTQQQEDYEIDISELFARILSSWKLVTFLTVSCGIVALLVTVLFITPTYEAKSTIYVLSRKDSALNISDLQIGASLTQDYVQVFKMWEVHEEVLSNLDLPYTYEQISKMLNVTNITNTRMLDITVTSPDPQEAADIAN
jgi:capsular polysaccharide biosynthesis protein